MLQRFWSGTLICGAVLALRAASALDFGAGAPFDDSVRLYSRGLEDGQSSESKNAPFKSWSLSRTNDRFGPKDAKKSSLDRLMEDSAHDPVNQLLSTYNTASGDMLQSISSIPLRSQPAQPLSSRLSLRRSGSAQDERLANNIFMTAPRRDLRDALTPNLDSWPRHLRDELLGYIPWETNLAKQRAQTRLRHPWLDRFRRSKPGRVLDEEEVEKAVRSLVKQIDFQSLDMQHVKNGAFERQYTEYPSASRHAVMRFLSRHADGFQPQRHPSIPE